MLDVIRDIEARGLRITAAGSELKLRGPKERMDPDLIARIRTHKADLLAHLAALPDERLGAGFGLTPLQRSYLLGRGDQFEIGNVAAYVYQEVEGVWDLDRLASALRAVVARHGMLRTRVVGDRQVEQAGTRVELGRVDLRELPVEQREAAWHRLREQRSHLVLPADRAPLMDAGVTILADDRMILHVGLDGLAADAVSGFLVFRDWWRAYGGETLPEPEQGASFEAFVAAMESARTKAPARRSRAYWLERLDDLPPAPALPLRVAPSSITEPRFTPRVLRLEPEPWARLKARCTEFGLTPSTVLFAAYAETLSAWGAGDRFTLNSTIANRPPIHPRIADTVGNFTDILLVEIDLDQRLGFADRARALQARLHRDLDNRHFSGIEVLRELGRHRGDPAAARMPYTFTSTVGYLQRDLDYSARELFGPRVFAVTETPQVWINAFVAELHEGLVVTIDGVEELFPDGLLDDLSAGYLAMLERLLDESTWTATTVDLLPPAQRARRERANDTAVAVPDALATDAFAANAERDPHAPALVTSRGTMDYGELYRRALAAAGWLRAGGAGRDELVGLVMTRGPEQVVGILATLLAGAAYLPVDADLPPARREFLLRDGRVRHVLTNTDLADGSLAVLRLDASAPAPDAEPLSPAGTTPDDLAYVLYTSGTTGDPKGVMVTHRSVVNVVTDCNTRFGITAGDRFFGVSAFTFDLSVYDVLGALSAGAALVLPDADKAADAAHWLALADSAGVTVWNSVPAIVSLLRDQAAADGALPASLRLVMMSGDRIPAALPPALHALAPDLRLVSLGGPTETTVWNIVHPIDDLSGGTVPYGRPNANNRAHVLDAHGRDAPDWVVGEICAAGTGLARGYWGDEGRTAERFTDDPVRGRLYRTGDLGRYLPDGTIDIVGRADHQLKVNGYRIEAGEVETHLAALEAVTQAVVVRQESAGGDRLVAHLTGEALTDGELRAHLGARLPAYLVPSEFVWHPRLPLTRNNKVDRTALAERAAGARATPRSDGPAPESAHAMARLWASVLSLDEVGVDDNFFELGGHSVAAARIVTAVRREFGVSVPLQRLPEVVTPRAMAGFVVDAS
ncbi:non-ribosomal peptide synthetase [Actinophytocola xinjiangensis]|uniref:Phenyloxazoline synthase MbtB n=1 Tax=Actinophytocola xinjiangensis TaxID=485602 RepID=A0A7Z0WU95_9PSEU|nr:non-ribosomal peptide synthetase [Actinophytocola xinjiangensis]OLF14046.1 non-ribosomal peptide synthetase [Actinophytocola xinjiangensis]